MKGRRSLSCASSFASFGAMAGAREIIFARRRQSRGATKQTSCAILDNVNNYNDLPAGTIIETQGPNGSLRTAVRSKVEGDRRHEQRLPDLWIQR